jgi:predicted porin
MKKHLIAAAVAAAVAVPAAAQVTVYGAVGTGVEQTKTQLTTSSSSAASNGTRFSGGGQGLGTSVIGFRGSEDLGGGLKAEFLLEGSLQTNSGEVGGGSGNSATNQTFDRQSWVGVSGAFGSFRFGRTATASKDIEGYGDLGTNIFDLGGPVDSFTDRFANTIRYQTPTFAGFNVVLTQTNGKDTVKNATNHDAKGVEISSYVVNYSKGPLSAGVGSAESKSITGFNANNTLFGASYKLGFATLEVGYQTEKPDADGTDKLTQFGAIVPLGNGVDVRLNYSKLDVQGTGAAATSSDLKHVGIMGVSTLSKRTRAYAGYRDTTGGAGAAATAASKLTTVGLIHSF